MEKKKVSIILFYDCNGKIMLQDRRGISKRGEEYGFFGGHSEKGEIPRETLKREIMEELEIDIDELNDFEFFKNFKIKLPAFNLEVERNIFLAKIPSLENLKVNEGKPAIMEFKDSFSLKMVPGDIELLKEIHEYLSNHIF